jgi:hypothetical protein
MEKKRVTTTAKIAAMLKIRYLVDRMQTGEVVRDIQTCYAMTSHWKNMFDERGGRR